MGNDKKTIYGIVGLGKFGMALAHELADSGTELIVLDKDADKVNEMREYTENAFIINNIDKKTLSETGIQNCDVVINCIGSHLDISILVTLNLVSLGIKKVIAKATSTEHGEILEKLGAEVVYPDRDMAERLANRLEAGRMLDFVTLSEHISISKLVCPDSIVGKSVQELNLRKEYSVNIFAVESGQKLYEIVSPSYVFKEDDILFLSGSKNALTKISALKNK